jgi:nicotinamidase-related amidase
MKKALIIVDMLNDFVLEGAPLQVRGAEKIIPSIKKQIEIAKKENYPVIYVCDNHDANDKEFEIWPKHCVEGTDGAKVVKELAPESEDIIVPKTRYSGFYNTNLDEILKKHGIDTLIVTGLVTNICVLYTVADAVSRNYKVIVPKDCVIGLDDYGHEVGLYQIKNVHNGEII